MKKAKLSVNWKWVVLWSLWFARLVRQPTTPVLTSSGDLRGSVSHCGSYKHYLGIPYARIPQRFKVATEVPKWNGVFEAINEHKHCPQKILSVLGMVTGQEDCLVINVFAPIVSTPEKLLPVMVMIHGGGFFFGSGTRFLYGPEYLLAKNIILVTFNYRLGVLGFLCLGIDEAQCNLGLKDQVAALQWIKRNIKAFGGDPENVTIFGVSAGGASVSFHLISSLSKGLFHKAIMQSGTSVAPWAIQYDPITTAARLAKALGYETDDPYNMYYLFMNKTARELISAEVPRLKGDSYFGEIIFVPCVEKFENKEKAFLTDLPYNIYMSGNYTKVPTIIGVNSVEGFLLVPLEKIGASSKTNIQQAIPKDLVFTSPIEKKQAAEEVQRIYLGNDIIENNLLGYAGFLGEAFFVYPAVSQTLLMLNTTSDQPVYNYYLDYSGWRNFLKFMSGFPFLFEPGATHGDELMYLFKPCMAPSLFEDKMIDTMTTHWTDFAKYGKPTSIEWHPTQMDSPQWQALGTRRMQPLMNTPSLFLWNDLYQKYRRTFV